MDRTLYVDKFYMNEVDTFKDSIYCHHASTGESFIPQHEHRKGQFLYAEGGIVFIKTEEKSYFLPARHYIWIPGGIKHSVHPSSPDVLMRNLYFPKFTTDAAFFDKVHIYPVNDLLQEFILFTNRWTGNIHPKEENKFTLAKAFKLILPEISKTEIPLALPYPKDDKLKAIILYMEERIHENINLKNIGEVFDISERTLARLFQRELNMNFIQYYTILRMLTALKLLMNSHKNINEIALLVGYNSLPTFSNTFKKIIGVRPSEYIKKNQ